MQIEAWAVSMVHWRTRLEFRSFQCWRRHLKNRVQFCRDACKHKLPRNNQPEKECQNTGEIAWRTVASPLFSGFKNKQDKYLPGPLFPEAQTCSKSLCVVPNWAKQFITLWAGLLFRGDLYRLEEWPNWNFVKVNQGKWSPAPEQLRNKIIL